MGALVSAAGACVFFCFFWPGLKEKHEKANKRPSSFSPQTDGKAGSLVDDQGRFYKPLQVGGEGERR